MIVVVVSVLDMDTGHAVAHCRWVGDMFDCWYALDNERPLRGLFMYR